MAADALTSYIYRSWEAMIMTMEDKHIFSFHAGKMSFSQSQYWKMMQAYYFYHEQWIMMAWSITTSHHNDDISLRVFLMMIPFFHVQIWVLSQQKYIVFASQLNLL